MHAHTSRNVSMPIHTCKICIHIIILILHKIDALVVILHKHILAHLVPLSDDVVMCSRDGQLIIVL